MQAKKKNGERNRISVSLDDDDYLWIKQMTGPAESLSYKLSRIVRAARLSGLTLEESHTGGVLEEFAAFLGKKKRNKHATELHQLLKEFLENN